MWIQTGIFIYTQQVATHQSLCQTPLYKVPSGVIASCCSLQQPRFEWIQRSRDAMHRKQEVKASRGLRPYTVHVLVFPVACQQCYLLERQKNTFTRHALPPVLVVRGGWLLSASQAFKATPRLSHSKSTVWHWAGALANLRYTTVQSWAGMRPPSTTLLALSWQHCIHLHAYEAAWGALENTDRPPSTNLFALPCTPPAAETCKPIAAAPLAVTPPQDSA